jgi:hypothetical protein
MSPMLDDHLGAVPKGMCWCPHCNGYGSLLKADADRCTHCGGSGLVMVADEPKGRRAARGQGRSDLGRRTAQSWVVPSDATSTQRSKSRLAAWGPRTTSWRASGSRCAEKSRNGQHSLSR